MISSACFTVWRRCAMMMTVLFLKRLFMASVTASSAKESRDDVGSSKRTISGFLRNIFAIASL